MKTSIQKLLLTILVLVATHATAIAQDYRILTEIETIRPKGQPNNSGTTLSIFHAGQVYDRVVGMDVVTIYQPAHKQFILFSAPHLQVTTVSFDEIIKTLQRHEDLARDQIALWKKKGDRESLKRATALQFRVTPQFKAKYDAKKGILSMKSKRVSYTAACASMKGKNPAIASEYLRYVDWMARLNSMMYVRAMFPDARLKVNAALKPLGVMPTTVERKDVPTGLVQRANHTIRWKLTKQDEQIIFRWNKLLTNPDMVEVTFKQFQRAVAVK